MEREGRVVPALDCEEAFPPALWQGVVDVLREIYGVQLFQCAPEDADELRSKLRIADLLEDGATERLRAEADAPSIPVTC